METDISLLETRERRKGLFFFDATRSNIPIQDFGNSGWVRCMALTLYEKKRCNSWGVDEEVMGTWEEITAAADTCSVKKKDDGSFVITYERRGELPPLSHKARQIRRALLKIPKGSGWVKEYMTDEDVDNFNFNLKVAEQELELFDKYLSYDANLIQHDSSVQGVMEQILESEPELYRYWEIMEIVKNLIKRAKYWHEQDLIADFLIFLSEFDYLPELRQRQEACRDSNSFLHSRRSNSFQSNYNIDYWLEKLKGHPSFVAKKFNDLEPKTLMNFLRSYIDRLRATHPCEERAEERIRSDVQTVERARKQLELLSYEKKRKCIPAEFSTPVHFLVYQRMTEGYEIRDPVIEITKARYYFGAYFAGVGRWIPEYDWKDAQFMDPPSQRKVGQKRKSRGKQIGQKRKSRGKRNRN